MQLNRTKPLKNGIALREYPVHNFIPYVGHLTPNTIITSDKSLIRVIKLKGFSFETAAEEDIDALKMTRNFLFKGMARPDVGLYFHIVRTKHEVYPDNYLSIDMPEGFAHYLDQKWFKKYQGHQAFTNDLYVSVIKKTQTLNFGLTTLINKFLRRSFDVKELYEAYEGLEEESTRLLNALKNYGPQLLGLYQNEHGECSQIAEFLGQIVNCGAKASSIHTPFALNTHLANHRLYAQKKYLKAVSPGGQTKFAGMVSIKEYSSKTWAGMLDIFLKLPFECIISQSFQFINRQAAIYTMQLQQNRMIQSEDKGVSQVYEITEAMDQAVSGEIAFGKHHLTIMCMADTSKELDNILSNAAVELTNTGGMGVREKVNMEAAFWAQLPGNFDFIGRGATINTLNLASLSSLHNYPTGQQHNNHWGEAVTVLDTTSGTPYYFNFHLRDVGHTTIIGPTGAGKTLLMNFLCAQAQRFKCRLFFFDKDRGAEIFMRALSAEYNVIDPGSRCMFNPLSLPDTGENRIFLLDWLKQLASVNGETLSTADIDCIATAINGNYKLSIQDRKLSNIAPFFGMAGPGTLAGRIAMWHTNGSHSHIFDHTQDNIDFSKNHIFGFEMGELLKDKVSLGPVLSYIFHKIGLALDGTPTMIVLDEAWALIDNPIFAPKLKDWLKVLRKLNTLVIFATQSVEDASKSVISDTLIQQTATQIFLPNLKATEAYKTAFMLTDREFELIKTINPGSRYFLVKQGQDTVIARVNLAGMDDVINILSGRADTVRILEEVLAEFGHDPKIWISEFQKKTEEQASSKML